MTGIYDPDRTHPDGKDEASVHAAESPQSAPRQGSGDPTMPPSRRAEPHHKVMRRVSNLLFPATTTSQPCQQLEPNCADPHRGRTAS